MAVRNRAAFCGSCRYSSTAVGTSCTRYGPLGFWARDSTGELWLYLLTQTIDSGREPPLWLRDARDDWRLQATAGMVGCVSAGFDQHLVHDPSREAVFLALLGVLHDRIAA
jgi:hypothetical protein